MELLYPVHLPVFSIEMKTFPQMQKIIITAQYCAINLKEIKQKCILY